MGQSTVTSSFLVFNSSNTRPAQSMPPGYLTVAWSSTNTTDAAIKIEYSEDGVTWLNWATILTGGDEQGDIFLALPEIDDVLITENLYFRINYESNSTTSGVIDVLYVYDALYEIVYQQGFKSLAPATTFNSLENKLFSFDIKENNSEWNIPLPNFDYDPSEDFKFDPEINEYVDEEGNLVYVLNDACSIPCDIASVTVDFDGCCMLRPTASAGEGSLSFGFTPAKAGTVTVSAPDSAGCVDVKVTINGQETKSLTVEACEEVSVEVTASVAAGQDSNCCKMCAFVESTPSQLIPECEGAVPFLKRVNKSTGQSKTYLSKKMLIKEIIRRSR